MSNLTLSMALAQNTKTATKDPAQQDSPMVDSPVTPATPVDGLRRPLVEETDGEDTIPVFAHTIPAIFVPLKQDLLAPIEPAKDRIERLQRMQKSLDANETAVRDNLAWMFEREASRRVADAKKRYVFSEPHRPETVDWHEAELLIASMSANPVSGNSYHVRPEKLVEWHEKIASVPPGYLPPHEQTTRDVLFVAHNGPRDIEGYSLQHIKPIRERLNGSLEKADGV